MGKLKATGCLAETGRLRGPLLASPHVFTMPAYYYYHYYYTTYSPLGVGCRRFVFNSAPSRV